MPNDPSRPIRGYAVCGAPRSGSNYFCDLLASTGALGRPKEYFNGATRRLLDDPTYPDEPLRQIDRILTMGATRNGIYALKLFPGLFDRVTPHLRLTEALPRLAFVRLKRRDVLGQAISWVRSMQTQQFRSTDAPKGALVFDAAAIRTYIGQVCQRDARWNMYFARTGISPAEIIYEEVVADPHEAVGRVADAMGVFPRPAIQDDMIKLQRQRDQVSQEWRERFVKECGDPNFIDSPDLLSVSL